MEDTLSEALGGLVGVEIKQTEFLIEEDRQDKIVPPRQHSYGHHAPQMEKTSPSPTRLGDRSLIATSASV